MRGERNGAQPHASARAQRAFCIAAAPDADTDLSELAELLRTAGVASSGSWCSAASARTPNTYLGAGKLAEARSRRASAAPT